MCAGNEALSTVLVSSHGLGWHIGLGNQITRIVQVVTLPLIAVFTTHAVQVRTRALASHWKGWS